MELTVKHPLQYEWTLWICKLNITKKWEDCLEEIGSFNTIEDFWSLYNYIPKVTLLPWMTDYYLFKTGIRPTWEDNINKDGGKWVVLVDNARRNELLDLCWLELSMAMVGEQFEDVNDHICGTVVNSRQKGDKISLWTKDAENDLVNLKIGEVFKRKLNIAGEIRYLLHRNEYKRLSL